MTQEEKLKEEICLFGKFLYKRGFLFATTGNISARMAGEVFITPRGKCKGELSPKEISKVSLNGKVLSGEPSSEWRMHLAIYKIRKDILAIIHAHPPFATLLSFSSKKFLSLDPNLETNLGEIKFIPYFKPGSKELAVAVGKAVSKSPRCDIFILKKHGVVVLGKDLREVRFKLESLEFFSQLFWRLRRGKI